MKDIVVFDIDYNVVDEFETELDTKEEITAMVNERNGENGWTYYDIHNK